jgi:hypothetical protein
LATPAEQPASAADLVHPRDEQSYISARQGEWHDATFLEEWRDQVRAKNGDQEAAERVAAAKRAREASMQAMIAYHRARRS